MTSGPEPAATLSLVVPAYNEGAVLRATLEALSRAFPEAELIVVDDGSSDDTARVARDFESGVAVLDYGGNRGKGCAVRTGVLAASGDLVVFTDADLPFGVEGVRAVVEAFAERPRADVVIAEKVGTYRGPLYRGARAVVRAGVRRSLGLTQADTQAGLKGFRRAAARAIFSECVVDGFAADMEVLALARRQGRVVVSVPLPLCGPTVRPSKFTVRQGVRLIRELAGIRRRLGR